jgi:hypothetical protein
MSSTRRPSRSRYRFGFRGKRQSQHPQLATTDEILDSLTRHAELMERNREEGTLDLQTVLEAQHYEEPTQSSEFEPDLTLEQMRNQSLGRYAFAAMLVGGLVFLWVYAKISQTLNLQSLASLQETISRAGFADWQRIALIALSALTIALVARHSRNRELSRAFATA